MLSWSLFGLLAVVCGGLLMSLHTLSGRMGALGGELRAEMRALRTELVDRMDGSDNRMEALISRIAEFRSDLRGNL